MPPKLLKQKCTIPYIVSALQIYKYKTIGYAGLLIAQMGKSNSSSHKHQYSSLDVSLTLLSCHYPRKLMKHLKQERNLPVAKISDGVYCINKEAFLIQIIVTKGLSPEDNLYLHYLTDNLQDIALINSNEKRECLCYSINHSLLQINVNPTFAMLPQVEPLLLLDC